MYKNMVELNGQILRAPEFIPVLFWVRVPHLCSFLCWSLCFVCRRSVSWVNITSVSGLSIVDCSVGCL